MEEDDESNLHLGLRAAFPVSFGKQETKIAPLEQVHSKTKRAETDENSHAKASTRSAGGKKKGPAFLFSFGVKGAERRGGGVVEVGGEDVAKSERGEEEIREGSGREGGENMAIVEVAGGGGDVAGRGKEIIKKKSRGKGRTREEEGEEDEDEDEDEDEEEEDEEDEEEDEFRVPLSNEVVLKGHTRAVTALAVDSTGSRVLTGGNDYTIKMYDFNGMDQRLRSFRELIPAEGHQVRALSWSPSADMFIAITGNSQAKIFDRDGRTKGEFVRGDMYIRDLRHTKGHISGLTGGEWHPVERQTALTSSEDGSIRIWDITNFKTQKQVVKPKLTRPGRIPVTSCCWGLDGKCVAAGLNDGSLQIWNVKSGWGTRPDLVVEKGHEAGDDVSSVVFSADATTLLSRSTDHSLKVWDVRKFKDPLAVFLDLPNFHGQTNVTWSPDELLFFTGTSAEKDGRGGQVVFFARETLQLVRRVGVSHEESVVRVAWHPRLNQIFATSGDKKKGGTHILYDPKQSERGALTCVARAPRAPRPEDEIAKLMPPVIHNPHALPLFRDAPTRKRQREKARKDPILSQRPDLPLEGVGHGGRIGTTKGSLLTQYLLREGGMLKETWMEEDPREAILRYAEAAEKDPRIITPAYALTQPKTILQESDEEEGDS